MFRRSSVVLSLASVAAFVLVPRLAFAQAPAAPEANATAAPADAPTAATPAPAPAAAAKPVDADKPKPKDQDEEDFKNIAITANPLSLILMRVGVNVELLPTKHHAIVVNPYFQSISVGSGGNETSYTNFGGELGYHFYTGERGANGFFIGPSLLVQQMSSTAKSTVGGQTTEANASITVYGAALDLGGQHVTKGGFTIGAGVGAQYLTASNTTTATSSTVKVSGVLPRFLLTVGYSF